ncbi:MAG TPA: sigma factor-like helix-turn-helix DNA-binding protein [Bryobacteraceae bacterium]|jgi:DNA-directed RNA polymerase specialized sigma24 family protein|nr:sigma factor-like helix-turn-helix DNA-binding protein [Bryobacteraceae bacterium]
MTREEYGQAYERGFDLTVRFLLSRGVYPSDRATDAAQAAWTRGWEKLGQLRNPGLIITWINTIALNVYRRRIRREPFLQLLPDLKSSPGIDLTAIEVGRILENCRPTDRRLLEQQLNGATVEEIALQHGVSETAVRIRLHRARRAARTRVESGSSRKAQRRFANAAAI